MLDDLLEKVRSEVAYDISPSVCALTSFTIMLHARVMYGSHSSLYTFEDNNKTDANIEHCNPTTSPPPSSSAQ